MGAFPKEASEAPNSAGIWEVGFQLTRKFLWEEQDQLGRTEMLSKEPGENVQPCELGNASLLKRKSLEGWLPAQQPLFRHISLEFLPASGRNSNLRNQCLTSPHGSRHWSPALAQELDSPTDPDAPDTGFQGAHSGSWRRGLGSNDDSGITRDTTPRPSENQMLGSQFSGRNRFYSRLLQQGAV